MSIKPAFPFSPLKLATDIRVITLKRGTPKDKVECSISNVKLEKDKYEALSYRCGTDTRANDVMIDGRTYKVPMNLYHALRQLRLQDSDRTLWIDQLCIDQNHNQEKLHQIQQMSDIYGKAKEVVVWLGLSNTKLDFAMDELQQDAVHLPRDMMFSIKLLHKGNPVSTLLECSYWGRVWIWQEIQLSQSFTIYCGEKTLAGAKFQNHVTANTKLGALDEKKGMVVKMMKARRDGESLTLSAHISDAMRIGLQCSEPRDIIFGMLAMASDDHRILPDYDKPAREVLEETLEYCLPRLELNGRKDKHIGGVREEFANKLAGRLNEKIGSDRMQKLLKGAAKNGKNAKK